MRRDHLNERGTFYLEHSMMIAVGLSEFLMILLLITDGKNESVSILVIIHLLQEACTKNINKDAKIFSHL